MKEFLLVISGCLLSTITYGLDPVRVDQGMLSGIKSLDGKIQMYKGIPYAAPPVGDLRWREPQPVKKWSGVRDANHYGNSAMQYAVPQNPWTAEFINDQPISEDCLYLNIWAPSPNKHKKYAVLVYLHGGGYTAGSGATLITDGENLARKGIIVIGINYRVGIFGFLVHPELTQESPHQSSGNYGLLDQLAALKWIKSNILAFGGDPTRVTICGQSAGAGCVHDLVASPLAKGLFSGAIAQSGSDLVPRRSMLTLQEAEKACSKFIESMGFKSLTELRDLQAEKLLSFTRKMPGLTRPIIDGYVLFESVPAVYRKGKENRVPILTGINADEDSSNDSYGKLTADEFKQQSENRYKGMYPIFNSFYPSRTGTQLAENQIQSLRDYGLASLYFWANERQKTNPSQIFIYYFSHPIPWPKFPQYGVFHCGEIPYVFNNLDKLSRPWQPVDYQLAKLMSDYWVNFVDTGNPNGKRLPFWQASVPNDNKVFNLDVNPHTMQALSKDKLVFFSKYFIGQLN